MIIVNKDRDTRIKYTDNLYTMPIFRKSLFSGNVYCVGINLYCGGALLDTYDSVSDALAVMERISAYRGKVYRV